jgi:hypothetical protein
VLFAHDVIKFTLTHQTATTKTIIAKNIIRWGSEKKSRQRRSNQEEKKRKNKTMIRRRSE